MNSPIGKLNSDKISARCELCKKHILYIELGGHRNRRPSHGEATKQAQAACYGLLGNQTTPGPADPNNGQAANLIGPWVECSREVCQLSRRYRRSDIELLVVDAIMFGRTWIQFGAANAADHWLSTDTTEARPRR